MKIKHLLEGKIDADCRDAIGVTVGLLDGLIAQIRVIRERDTENKDVTEVFKDLADDEDFDWLIAQVKKHRK
jgi:hypothetical protein